jgi:predicted lipoprotein with Yx(FWY)xxD motif
VLTKQVLLAKQLRRIGVAAVMFSAGITLAAPAFAVTGKFVPQTGILMTVGQDVDSINDYTASMGAVPAGVTNYVGITTLDGLNSSADAGAGRNNVRELATAYPSSALVVGVSMNGQVDAVAAGSYNNNIDTLLTTLASYNRPVFLRWAYEVDGPWNGHSTNGVIQSFRYVHDRIATLGFSNRIAMVWQTMSYCPIDSNIASWYPGDAYVDWVGLSYFAPQDCNGREVNKTADFAVAHNKPLMINESTPQRYAIGELTYSADAARGTGRVGKTASQIWSEWFAGYFGFMNRYSGNLKAVTYINANWNAQPRWASGSEGYWGDSRVEANATIKANWSSELNTGTLTGKPFISQASAGLFTQLGFNGSAMSSTASSSVVSTSSSVSSASSIAVIDGVFGMLADGTVYHMDGGQTASFVYLCVNGDCRTATKVNGRYERSYAPVNSATSYAIEFKIQDNATGQCLASGTVKPGEAINSTPCYAGTVASSSSVKSSSSAPASSSSVKSSISSSVAGNTVSVVNIAGLNYVVATGAKAGFTLYTFDNDLAGPSTCYGSCATTWPAYTIANVADLKAPAGVTLGTTIRTDGTVQVTLNNEPLYFYINDINVGDAKGNGLGGVWWRDPLSGTSSSNSSSLKSSNSSSSSSISSATSGVFGIQTDGIVYHLDGGQTASFVYICLNGNCQTAAKVNGRYQYGFGAVDAATTYTLEFKVQDNATGQCIATASLKPGNSTGSNCYSGVWPTSSSTASTSSSSRVSSSKSSLSSVSSKASSSSSIVTSSSSSRSSSSVAGNTVSVVNVAGVNYVVATGAKAGFTLYTFNNDQAGPSTCYGSCATNWPAYTIANAADLKAPAGVTLGTSTRTDGTVQVTLNNRPLYFYINDINVGDAKGNSLGGIWWRADVSGISGTSSSQSSASSVISSSSSSSVAPPAGDFGLVYVSANSGIIRHRDKPFSATFANLCLDGGCATATLKNGYWERTVSDLTLGAIYSIGTQIQDNAIGQCAISANVAFQATSAFVASSCLPADVSAPTVPTSLVGAQKNGRAASLSWGASTDDRGVANYEVYRNGVRVASPTATSFNDSGLTENTSYQYAVAACDAAKNCSAKTAEVTVVTGTFTPDTTPPTVPTGLTGKGASTSTVLLAWNASTDAAGVVASYNIFKDAVKLGSTATLQFTAGSLNPGESHSYSVQACDDSGNCSVKTGEITAASNPPSFANLDWTSNSYRTNKVGPLPRANPPEALATPKNGAAPTAMGFAFDIDGSTLRWRWGNYNVALGHNLDMQSGLSEDAGLEMYCSTDGGLNFQQTNLVNGTATIPCAGIYNYFFRWKLPGSVSIDPATQWMYTGYFTTAGTRVDVNTYPAFTDGSANWMRFRHPLTNDGVTAAILDAHHNNSLLRDLDRYTLWVNDTPGNVSLDYDVNGSVLRVETLTRADHTDGQQFFVYNQPKAFGNAFSYGQVLSFEITGVTGRIGSQTYNDFQHYTVGYGWSSKYGDPRLASGGKASTSQLFSSGGAYSNLEKDAIFTQPRVTFNESNQMDDFILGHHLFHGIDPNKRASHLFDDPDVRIGERTCGNCHFRDGRGSEIIQTVKGPRLPPPVYGSEMLTWIIGAQAGVTWDGSVPTVADQVKNALVADHKVNPDFLPGRTLELLTKYTQMLTVPSRKPGSYDLPGVAEGDKLFQTTGCAGCHTPIQRTRSDAPTDLRNLVIRPYTDMKLWNVNGGNFRTAPLWGLGHNIDLLSAHARPLLFMHDGSATSIRATIGKHTGDAAAVMVKFNALTETEKTAIESFVKTL